MSSILESLKSLREKLYSVVEEANVTKARIPSKSSEEKLNELFQIQTERIKIDVGGKHFLLSKSTILNSKFANIFQDQVNEGSSSLYFDGSPRLFEYVLKILRNTQADSLYDDINKLKIRVKEGDDYDNLKRVIEFFYKNNTEELYKIVEIKDNKTENTVEDNTNILNNNVVQNAPAYNYDGGYNNNRRANYDYNY
jgi:hypothetical protein